MLFPDSNIERATHADFQIDRFLRIDRIAWASFEAKLIPQNCQLVFTRTCHHDPGFHLGAALQMAFGQGAVFILGTGGNHIEGAVGSVNAVYTDFRA